MALAKDLMQVGIADQAALLIGSQQASVTAAGTTNADATVLLKTQTLVTVTGTAAQGVMLPADAPLGVPYVLGNTSANALLVYPPASGQINGDTATTGTSPLVARGSNIYIRTGTNAWIGIVGAAG